MAGLITKFIEDNPEDGDHNQYWYSESTIAAIIRDQVDQHELAGSPDGGLTIAFLSTPSLYYSLPEALRQNSYLFDFDAGPDGLWLSDRGYVAYDFNHPSTGIPIHLLGKVDMVIIDPPFIVEEVWAQYVITSKLLLKAGYDVDGVPLGKAVMTTVRENEGFLNNALGGSATAFRPSIPNLTYQYELFANYPSKTYKEVNPEIPI